MNMPADSCMRIPILSLASSKVPINRMQPFFKALKNTKEVFLGFDLSQPYVLILSLILPE